MTLTIEFNSINELRRKVRNFSEDIEAENLKIQSLNKLRSTALSKIRLDTRIKEKLSGAGINDIKELSKLSAQEFLAIDGLGSRSLVEVNLLLVEFSLTAIS